MTGIHLSEDIPVFIYWLPFKNQKCFDGQAARTLWQELADAVVDFVWHILAQ